MSYIGTRLDDCVAYGFTGGPEWSTLVVPLDNGREQRNGQWLYPRHRYSAQYQNLAAADRNTILTAFHAARGKLHAFRFKDHNDFTATAQPLVSVNGTLYLGKAYTFGSETSYRLIQAPVTATLSGAGSVDMTTGVVTGANPADTWTGTFDVWVRFDSDYNAFAIGNYDAHTADIELIEVRR